MIWNNIWQLIEQKQATNTVRIGSLEHYTKLGKPIITLNVEDVVSGSYQRVNVLKCKDHYHAIIDGSRDINAKTEKGIAQKLKMIIERRYIINYANIY